MMKLPTRDKLLINYIDLIISYSLKYIDVIILYVFSLTFYSYLNDLTSYIA